MTLVNRLDKRVTISKQDLDNTDSYGAPSEWIEVATVWAAIEPLQGREYFAALQESADVNTRIRVRYKEGIDRTMKVKYRDSEFEILYIINPKYGKKEMQLMCKERQ